MYKRQAHSGEIISEETAAKIKKLYYRLAKQIHPDMNPKTNEIPELKELWQRIVVSYRANDLEELEEAEILVNKFLVDHHLDGNEIKIQDIDTKIEKLKEQIQKIKETNPYQYRFLLQDQEAVQNKKRELQKELEEYRVYEQELDQLLEQMMKNGVSFLWRMN